jgi:hypothetical protein
MICCLLALLAALPGFSLVRRMQASRVASAHCASQCSRTLGRDISLAVAAAGMVVIASAGGLAIHKWSHGMYWQGAAPICSALNRVSPVQWHNLRVTEPDR